MTTRNEKNNIITEQSSHHVKENFKQRTPKRCISVVLVSQVRWELKHPTERVDLSSLGVDVSPKPKAHHRGSGDRGLETAESRNDHGNSSDIAALVEAQVSIHKAIHLPSPSHTSWGHVQCWPLVVMEFNHSKSGAAQYVVVDPANNKPPSV